MMPDPPWRDSKDHICGRSHDHLTNRGPLDLFLDENATRNEKLRIAIGQTELYQIPFDFSITSKFILRLGAWARRKDGGLADFSQIW